MEQHDEQQRGENGLPKVIDRRGLEEVDLPDPAASAELPAGVPEAADAAPAELSPEKQRELRQWQLMVCGDIFGAFRAHPEGAAQVGAQLHWFASNFGAPPQLTAEQGEQRAKAWNALNPDAQGRILHQALALAEAVIGLAAANMLPGDA